MTWNSISADLKARRLAVGLSLTQASRRAGTSAATLSRYENGWTRFELYTLKKLAAALGCELDIRLKAIPRSAGSSDKAARIARLRRLFWDRPLRDGDIRRHPRWVLERVLEYGQLDDVHDVMSLLGRDVFLEQIRRVKGMSPKTREFWRLMLEEEPQCTKKPCRPQAANFWSAWKR
jgi:transcriptional regulator with XRE-family HTH domain